MYKEKHTYVNTHTHTHTHTGNMHRQIIRMLVQTNNLSQSRIFVAPNELTLKYSRYGNIIGQL